MKPEVMKHFKCEHCDISNSDNLMCCECWTDLAGCDCYDDLSIWEMQILCSGCGETTNIETREIDALLSDEDFASLVDDDEDDFEWGEEMLGWIHKKDNKKDNKPATTGTAKPKPQPQTWATMGKCRHYDISMEIAKGVFVYPSSMNNDSPEKRKADKDPNVIIPDFGLYADKGWSPAWRNEFVTFPDYQIPTYDIAVTQITEAAERAASGEKVELGCIGGHGRTGTMLACMLLWGAERDGKPITGEEACELVWYFYCEEAIESKSQEWWVSYYAHHQFGYELPEKPKPPAPKISTSTFKGSGKAKATNVACQVREHLEMMAAGAKECLSKGKTCEFWEEDNMPGVESDEPLRQWEVAKYKKQMLTAAGTKKNATEAVKNKKAGAK